MDLSSKFYSHIPHNIGHSRMSAYIINTLDKVKFKCDLIDDLIGINKVVMQSDQINNRKRAKSGLNKSATLLENPLDQLY